MGPYSENNSISNETPNNELLTMIPEQVITETPSPSTLSATTTPSPTLQEIIPIVEDALDPVDEQNDNNFIINSYYPGPGNIMPYDHSLPDFIRQITNEPNLENLQSLRLRIISTCISLHRMSAYLPNLKELDLEGSILNSLSWALSTGIFGWNLWFITLRIICSKKFNYDVSPCSNLPHIKHIDLSGNRIRNISYAGFLSVCSKLKSITFTGNPATELPDYRNHIRKILPQLELLDGVPFSADEAADNNKNSPDHENYHNESEIQNILFSSLNDNNVDEDSANSNGSDKKNTENENQLNSDNKEMISGLNDGKTTINNSKNLFLENNIVQDNIDKSNSTISVNVLTSGSPVRGNLIAALRNRSKALNNQEKIKSKSTTFIF
ncbi:conserved hypothetical protein [Pediculus humanus corporis]|uniref:Leucine-rich repeat-containing protein n=1 Tax=Pediculus humanus subsp. corporis TaxID=121224 RepID=E0VB93_PEDHC|nr:uncharacterized protein Phum_PHUM055350 [Pediculus humanus corporis]EEB10649.1 conserved hypothetical protein [Pediculus humanus corporis]